MAAYAYCKRKKISYGKFLIYDYGGGTFDAAVVSVENNIFRIVDTFGDSKSGGDDITNSILEELLHIRDINDPKLSNTALTPEERFRLKREAEKLKKEAKSSDPITIDLEKLFGIPDRFFKQSILTNEIRKRVEDTIDSAVQLDQKYHVDHVLMIGGSSAFFYCQQKMSDYFGERLVHGVDVSYCVSQGAAMCTQELHVENAVPQIRNQLRCTLGFETRRGSYYFCNEGDLLPREYKKNVVLDREADSIETVIVEKRNGVESLGGTMLKIQLNRTYPKNTKFELCFAVKNDLLFYIAVQDENGHMVAPMQKIMLH